MTSATTTSGGVTRKLRATIIGLGLDGPVQPLRIVHGDGCFLIGGSDETQAELLETMQRLAGELERLDRDLAEVEPDELARIAQRIDSPELEAIALRLVDGLAEDGRSFGELTAQELTAMAS